MKKLIEIVYNLLIEAIAARFGEFFDQALGSDFPKIVPKRCQTVLMCRHLQGGQNVRIKFNCRKGASRGDVSETYQGVHHGQLSWMVEFQAGNPFTTGKHCGLCQLTQLTSVDEGFQDVLLDAPDSCRKWLPASLAVGVSFPPPS